MKQLFIIWKNKKKKKLKISLLPQLYRIKQIVRLTNISAYRIPDQGKFFKRVHHYNLCINQAILNRWLVSVFLPQNIPQYTPQNIKKHNPRLPLTKYYAWMLQMDFLDHVKSLAPPVCPCLSDSVG